MFGMEVFCHFRVFEKKYVDKKKLLPLAAAYVGYIVLCNLNLNLNPVGFYQIMKIAVAPAVLLLEFIFYRKTVSPRTVASIVVVCLGVGMATVTDPQISSNILGLLIGLGSVIATAMYQIWAGRQQKGLGLGSMQLLHQYVPLAAGLLLTTVFIAEPIGLIDPSKDTLIGYPYDFYSVFTIFISAVLGLLVNLSTFLVIGATSSLTYNVVGHVKTLIILAGGVFFFGDSINAKKIGGIGLAMCGIVWYSQIKLEESRISNASALKGDLPILNKSTSNKNGGEDNAPILRAKLTR